MNKKLVVIAAALLLIIGAMFVLQSFVFGMGGTFSKDYDTSYSPEELSCLDNLKKQENRLSEILKMATTVKDVLEVEKELGRVRGEIERLTGRMNYLEQSIEMSTISVDINEPAPFFDGWGIVDSFKQAVKGFIQTINALEVF